ncbi:hypothetical protein BTVI_66700 [Pitangus sulphuratus]|nr:hypothetical protein BTVI_66700 [Pitangus sulphuratus]
MVKMKSTIEQLPFGLVPNMKRFFDSKHGKIKRAQQRQEIGHMKKLVSVSHCPSVPQYDYSFSKVYRKYGKFTSFIKYMEVTKCFENGLLLTCLEQRTPNAKHNFYQQFCVSEQDLG